MLSELIIEKEPKMQEGNLSRGASQRFQQVRAVISFSAVDIPTHSPHDRSGSPTPSFTWQSCIPP